MVLRFYPTARLLTAILLLLFPAVAHCGNCFCFASTSPKAPFRFRLELPGETWDSGTVQYEGSNEQLTLRMAGTKELERYEGRPSYWQYTWNEWYRGKMTGSYVLRIQGAVIYESWYMRKRDGKKFLLKHLSGAKDCAGCGEQ